ncbi:MAG: peptidylprolyl isomerase [Anaerolineales bacterium]|jgi:peptidyl-prolyl cis-trans isomerase D
MAKQDRRRFATSRKHMARVERENLQRKYILWTSGVVLALVVGFILYGILEQTVLKPRQPVARVNGESVTIQEFQARTRYARNSIIQRWYETYSFSQMFGDDPSTLQYFSSTLNQLSVQLQGISLGQQVLDQLVGEALIRQEAARRGISISKEELDNSVEEFFGYYRAGTPTPAPTDAVLPTPTLSLTQMALLPPTPTPGPTGTPEIEAELEADETQQAAEEEPAEEQATETPVVEEQPTETPAEPAEPTATLAPSPTPTTYTLDLFQENYQESLTYLSENLGMSEAEFRTMIENQMLRTKVLEAITADISTEQEQVWARHILVPDAETAQEVLDRLQAGDDFAALAAEYSMDGSGASGGDLGWFTRDMMVAEFSEAAFNLEIGEISPAVESQFGFHIIQVLGKDVFPLTGAQLDQLRETRFQEWLADQREASQVEIFDRWVEVTPSQPAIPAELEAQVQQQLQSAAPAVAPLDSFFEEDEAAPVPEEQ